MSIENTKADAEFEKWWAEQGQPMANCGREVGVDLTKAVCGMAYAAGITRAGEVASQHMEKLMELAGELHEKVNGVC